MKYKRKDIEHMVKTGHKVIKMGRKESENHGYTWFECKDCDWKTIEKLVTNQPK